MPTLMIKKRAITVSEPPEPKPRRFKDKVERNADEEQAMRSFDSLIAAAGGPLRLSKFIGVSKQHVNQWRARGCIGKHWALLLDEIPAVRAAGITKEKLRPDLNSDDWARLESQKCLIADRRLRKQHMISQTNPLINA